MSANLLPEQREALLAKLQEADDAILVSAVHKMEQQQREVVAEWLEVREFVRAEAVHVDAPAAETYAGNVKPPGEPSKKIGKETTDLILERLAKPHTADEVNSALRRPDSRIPDTESLLALLWVRKLVLFDGELYRKI